METKAYKTFHESFMINNNGTTPLENFFNILPIYFYTFATVNIVVISQLTSSVSKFFIEFLLIIFMLILQLTIINDKITEIVLTLVLLTITSAAKQIYKKTYVEPFIQIPTKRPEFINLVRGAINLVTAVCILAVDFQHFPRKLAKTETFGFGLMDAGVGLYVFSNGIISSDVRSTGKISWNLLMNTFLNNSPLIILGISRFFVTNQIDYQQHISEYGVHWNFFITLAITKIFGTIIMSILQSPDNSKYAAIVVVVIHETLLQLGFADYVMNSKRDNFLSANREGIISCMGYIALYLASVYLGRQIQFDNEISRVKDLIKKSLKLGILAVFFWKMIYVCEAMFGVSRRLGNMGYVMWILSIGSTMVTLFIFLEIFYHIIQFERNKSGEPISTYGPIIINSINYNGLVFFLLANLLTGLVNIIFQTMLIDMLGCLVILIVYMFVLCGVTTFLYVQKIKLKIW